MANFLGTLTYVLTAGISCYLTFVGPSYAWVRLACHGLLKPNTTYIDIGKVTNIFFTVSVSSFILNMPVPQIKLQIRPNG